MGESIKKLNEVQQKVNILMVDDRPENLFALQSVLAYSNYNLVTATSGEEALKHVLQEDFSVILLDVQMPGMNGFETAKLIKARERSKQIPIVFITAISQALEHVKNGYSVGAIDYIFKPFHPETLRMKVKALVEMQQQQEQIKLQNELLRIIGETTTDTIVTFDHLGHILTVNEAVTNMFGYTSAECIGLHINRLVPTLHFRSSGENERIVETVALRKDKTKFPSDIQIGMAAVKKQQIFVCSIRDVTERKLSDEERFRRIFNATPCLIELRSLEDKRYMNVNESWLSYTGHTYEDIMKQTHEEIQYIMDLDGLGETSVGIFELTAPVRNARISYWTKSQDMREGLLSTEIMEIRGEACILSIITDITDRVAVEKEIAKFARLNLMGEMAAGIIHEIRNPMTTVRGFLQMSKNHPSTEYIDIMIEELDRTHNIITEFLSVTKTAATLRVPKQLNDIVQTLFPLIQAKAMVSDKYACMELGDCPPLSLDEKEIRQLILNLALNGLEAMSSKGVLTIKTYTNGPEVILEVQDEGYGIKEELLEKIGTPFFSTKVNGTGLGLSVCHGVVARHNAVMKVKTSEQGTKFLIHFNTENSPIDEPCSRAKTEA
ncbi:response regulator [Ectobacillus funiculus]|uniref:response regulator n=1 Tax=Ectobacillus funiculus TaxID=137993 RepID=UPI001FEAE4D9|nr:response regulator [Ectobacillus funiculus]